MSRSVLTEAQWLAHYTSARESQQSLSGYARAHGINADSLYSAVGRLRAKGLIKKSNGKSSPATPSFVKAKVGTASDSLHEPLQVTVTLPSMLRVDICGSDATAIAQLIRSLEQAAEDHGTTGI